ncbi:ferredoxin [Tamlana nanhaiensis]|uniref:Ferredoxin n=1 Tax=Neotamlana nanhaiensis TaxID=1382798 RepID=A0A0D7W0P8_9FLAO|nr:DUF4198 domain-containing protein [Tamlana nanhaiensis]KJD32096.1 ferredoxin [Tamlana nanhaiensis]KJD32258.1 ferredoxin [Tamlana nanhaiensis]
MKKTIFAILLLVLATTKSFAHYLWVETNPYGTIGEQQDIKVYFGEYTYGVIEEVKGDAFSNVKNFTLWIVDQAGNKTQLTVTPKADHYIAKFTPKANGVYTVILNNNDIDVIDYTKYDFGIFKTHYHATAKFQVGKTLTDTSANNPEGIVVKDVSKNPNEVTLQVLYKNKPLANNELQVYVSDLWSKTLHTNEQGEVTFKRPWNTKYIVETTTKEEVPGTFKGKDYEFIWHCATYCLP